MSDTNSVVNAYKNVHVSCLLMLYCLDITTGCNSQLPDKLAEITELLYENYVTLISHL